MCDELDLDGVRRWFYGGTPPAGDGGSDDAEAMDGRAFAAAVMALAEARAGLPAAPDEPAPRARSRAA
ncbi:hypothetical protein [Ideonella sp.]|uniref:hypothetical protein n=1 Tax=Ideonella sp. TaxID=1929293 RepID=UPI002B483CF4|nr:hypothetical protein [Ideonella sp.]HJV70762.1 hypothetical protein [Ideonella sp.]